MTKPTRRRLLLALILVVITLPLDLVMVRAVSTDGQTSAADWAARLSDSGLQVAADRVQDFPLAYRKQIMARLTPERRAEVWRRHVEAYRDNHPELTTEQVQALNAAIEAIHLTFLEPGVASRAFTRVAGEHVRDLLGTETADYLLHRLGDRTTLMLASAVPWYQKLTDYARDHLVVQAVPMGDCWCNGDWGCDELAQTWCDDAVSCTPDTSWPACGWLWDDECNGVCKVGVAG